MRGRCVFTHDYGLKYFPSDSQNSQQHLVARQISYMADRERKRRNLRSHRESSIVVVSSK